jgi:alpha-1,2-mannosyltransferase
MKLAVIHDSLNFAGGAERVCLKTIEALQESGHNVCLGTVDKTDWSRIGKILGEDIRPDVEIHLLRRTFGMLRPYLDVMVPLLEQKIRKAYSFCLNTNADAMPTGSDVSYLHYVPGSVAKGEFYRRESLSSEAVSAPYRLVQRMALENLARGRLLTNSRFSQRAIRKCLGFHAEVVYPPVKLGQFQALGRDSKKNRIVTTGRMSPERNFEVILSIASAMLDVEFTIIGHSSGARSRSYYDKLCRVKAMKNLHNVSIILNDSFSRMLSQFQVSKIFLHTMRGEALGLSVVEAMACGLVPIVVRSGGPWEDILEGKEGVHGYSYSNIDEAIAAIRLSLSETKTSSTILVNNDSFIELFSDLIFKEKISEIVNDSLVS